MKPTTLSAWISAVLCVAAVSAPTTATAQTLAEGQFDRTLRVSGPIVLDVSTGSGGIDIRRGADGAVQIHGRVRAGSGWSFSRQDAEDRVHRVEANPPIEQNGQTIRVGRSDERDTLRNISISYEIVVPAQARVTAATGSGGQTIAGLDGQVTMHAGSGGLVVRDLRGDLDATTGSGAIRVSNIRGSVRAHTGSGGIAISGEQTGAWDVQAGSGAIDIDLPPTAAFDLRAQTGSGGIDVQYPITVQGRINSRRSVEGKVAGGGPLITARTGSGHIRVQ